MEERREEPIVVVTFTHRPACGDMADSEGENSSVSPSAIKRI